MEKRKDKEKEGFRKGGMQNRRYAGKEGFRKRGSWNRVTQEGRMQEWRERGKGEMR